MNRDELRPCTCMYGRMSKMVRMANGDLKETILNPGKEYNGYFHEWYFDGIGCRAIVETGTGSIVTPYAEDVRFTDRADGKKNTTRHVTIADIVNQLKSRGYTCEEYEIQNIEDAATIKEIILTKTIKKCVDKNCVWRLDKYENGCGKFTNLQTCIDNHGKMTEEEASRRGLI